MYFFAHTLIPVLINWNFFWKGISTPGGAEGGYVTPEYFCSSELHKSHTLWLGGKPLLFCALVSLVEIQVRELRREYWLWNCWVLLGSDKCTLGSILDLPVVSWCLMCAIGPVVLCCFCLWRRWYLRGLRLWRRVCSDCYKGGLAVRVGVCDSSPGQSDFSFFLHVSTSELCCGRWQWMSHVSPKAGVGSGRWLGAGWGESSREMSLQPSRT